MIIGGGLAGLALGIGLRQRGVPVTIQEAGDYPRHRVCGEFISGNGQAVLEQLGLLGYFQKAGAIHARTAKFVCGMRRSPVRKLDVPALCLSRYKMDALLATAFRDLGGDLRTACRAPSDARAEGVVAATGRRLQSADHGARWFGLKAHVPNTCQIPLEADLEMHLSRDGYIGVTRIDAAQINVCGLFPARSDNRRPDSKTEWLRGEPGSLLNERLSTAVFESESFCSVAGIQLKPQRASAKAECCIGDALTMTPPVTGNGMSMAFESAELAISPLADFSGGQLTWSEARGQIAAKCDAAFSRRLAWARILQWMMVSSISQGALGSFLLGSDWLWSWMFARTR